MTGIELIAQEREEQIKKHKWDYTEDRYYADGQMKQAAKFCLTLDNSDWPKTWHKYWRSKIIFKSDSERLIVAAALLAAELDRIQSLTTTNGQH